MIKFILITTVLCAVSSCVQFKPNEHREPAQTHLQYQCPISREAPPLFTVLENTSANIKVSLNNFIKTFEITDEYYDVHVTYEDTSTKEYRYGLEPAKIITILNLEQVSDPYTINIPVTKTGAYIFELKNRNKIFWKQKVFSINQSDQSLTNLEKENLAKKFSPILNMHADERYFPASLEYIFNMTDIDSELAEEPFIITNKSVDKSILSSASEFLFGKKVSTTFSTNFLLKDISKILPYYGHSESVLKSGLNDSTLTKLKTRHGKNHLTVYYSVFEDNTYGQIYINYHFFYAYDPKNGTADKDALPAHIFDRESLTVAIRKGSLKPTYVIYGAHLASQRMAILDTDKTPKFSWLTGRVSLNWDFAIKENDRLKAVAALGSHGIYPIKGIYAVMGNDKIRLLEEPAGGGPSLYPNFDAPATESLKYELKMLPLEKITSDCQNAPLNLLAYSGSTVDVLGPTNATFPPFTDRESDYKNYLDIGAAPAFEMDKALEIKY